ncbi:MAG TPA: fluoride efflux transporter CrcB [Candidatus Tumulicola sp.]|jgi:CrcB protein
MIEPRAIVLVAIGASIGGVLRYVVGQLFFQRFGPGFPYGTLFINVTGSFLIGIIAELAASRAMGATPAVRIFAATGILGGYTTFSTFALDGVTLAEQGWLIPTIYVALSIVLGLTGAALGGSCVRLAIR